MKRLDWKHADIDFSVASQKRSRSLSRNVATTCQRDMWMPRPQIGLQSGRDCGFLDALMNLKKMRMPFPDPGPDYFGRPFGGKRAQSLDRKKKAAKTNGTQTLSQIFECRRWRVPEKSEGKMHLFRAHPLHAPKLWVKRLQRVRD